MQSKMPSIFNRNSANRPAFTLIEMLVVIGIIILLVGIAFPVLSHVQRTAKRTKIASDLQSITVALDAYKADFGIYPPVNYDPSLGTAADRPNPPLGAQILCEALVGPAPGIEQNPPNNLRKKQDGAGNVDSATKLQTLPGMGFRVRPGSSTSDAQGKVYGPYLATDRFHFGDPASPATSNPSNVLLWTLLDANNQPILYFPAAPSQARINITTNYLGKNPTAPPQILYMYNLADNLGIKSVSPLDDQVHTVFTRLDDTDASADAKRIGILLGDYDPNNPSASTNFNNGIDAGEHAATTGPYILWSAGPDGVFGCGDKNLKPTAKEISNCDDVTNFNMGTQ